MKTLAMIWYRVTLAALWQNRTYKTIWSYLLKSEDRISLGKCLNRSSQTFHRANSQQWRLLRVVSILTSQRGSYTWMNKWIQLLWPRERQEKTVILATKCKNIWQKQASLSLLVYRAQLQQRCQGVIYSERLLSKSLWSGNHLKDFAWICRIITRLSPYPSSSLY